MSVSGGPCDRQRSSLAPRGPPDLHRAPAGGDLRRPARASPGRPRSAASTPSSAPTTSSRWAAPGEPGPDRLVRHAGRAGPGDVADPARHAGHLGDVPPTRPARDRRGAGRRDVGRAGRARARRGLVRGRAPGLRHPVPAAGRALRPAHRAAGDHHRAVGDAGGGAVLVHRRALHARRLAGAAEAGAAAAPARDRRGQGQARTPRARRPVRRPSSTCRSRPSTTSRRSSRACDAACERVGRDPAEPGPLGRARWSAWAATTPRSRGGPEAIGRDGRGARAFGLAGTAAAGRRPARDVAGADRAHAASTCRCSTWPTSTTSS